LTKKQAAYVADHYADYWVTNDKLVCSINQLATRHLLHIIAFVQRGADRKLLNEMLDLSKASMFLQGEYALDAVDNEMHALGQLNGDEYLERDPRYCNLVKELRRRGYDFDESKNAWPRQFVLDLTGGSTRKRTHKARNWARAYVFGPQEDGLTDPYHGTD